MAQQQHHFALHILPEECAKGSAMVQIGGINSHDSVGIAWSTGQISVQQIGNLEAGDYHLGVRIVTKYDTIRTVKDTLIKFTVEKTLCPVSISKYFSPNDDGYNDRMTIGNIENHPNFELVVYNKWGQRVHHQQGEPYQPWEGKWLGTNLPDGTYYYILFYDKNNKDKLVKGDITILR